MTLLAFAAAPSLAFAQDDPSAPVQEAPSAVAQDAQAAPGDPWEGFNRSMFATHEAVDGAVIEPVARGYRAVTPGPVREGVLNFLRNLRGPVIFANDVLQGEFGRAGTTAGRFAINSTVGIVGVLDPATSMGLERHDEDFGQTLAVWGVPEGPYVFVPLFGPTNVRDGAGRIVDVVFDPLSWVGGDDIDAWRSTRTVTAGVTVREQLLEAVDATRASSVDPYISVRTSYNLLRQSAIQNGRTDVQQLPEFDDIPDGAQGPAPDGGSPIAFVPAEQHMRLGYFTLDDLVGVY
ncbi:MAG: MlaA family lipoprotein [Vitreimonas sp.]